MDYSAQRKNIAQNAFHERGGMSGDESTSGGGNSACNIEDQNVDLNKQSQSVSGIQSVNIQEPVNNSANVHVELVTNNKNQQSQSEMSSDGVDLSAANVELIVQEVIKHLANMGGPATSLGEPSFQGAEQKDTGDRRGTTESLARTSDIPVGISGGGATGNQGYSNQPQLGRQDTGLSNLSSGFTNNSRSSWDQARSVAKLLPSFSGSDSENVRRWLERVLNLAALYNIQDNVLLVAVKIQLEVSEKIFADILIEKKRVVAG